MTKELLKSKVEEAIYTVDNLRVRIFDGNDVWAGETNKTMNNVLNRLEEYYAILDKKKDNQ